MINIVINIKNKILLIIVVLATISAVHTTWRIARTDPGLSSRQKELADLGAENRRLIEAKKAAETTEFVEREARDKLGKVKPGEVVVVLPSEDVLRGLAPKDEPEETPSAVLPVWRQWVRLFVSELEKTLPRG